MSQTWPELIFLNSINYFLDIFKTFGNTLLVVGNIALYDVLAILNQVLTSGHYQFPRCHWEQLFIKFITVRNKWIFVWYSRSACNVVIKVLQALVYSLLLEMNLKSSSLSCHLVMHSSVTLHTAININCRNHAMK